MRVHLVTMPWHPLDLPSLQLGLLQEIVRRARPGDEVTEFHGSLRWAEYLLERSGGRLLPGDYVEVAATPSSTASATGSSPASCTTIPAGARPG